MKRISNSKGIYTQTLHERETMGVNEKMANLTVIRKLQRNTNATPLNTQETRTCTQSDNRQVLARMWSNRKIHVLPGWM